MCSCLFVFDCLRDCLLAYLFFYFVCVCVCVFFSMCVLLLVKMEADEVLSPDYLCLFQLVCLCSCLLVFDA